MRKTAQRVMAFAVCVALIVLIAGGGEQVAEA